MSHFAYADAPGHPTVRAQRETFERYVGACERAGLDLSVRSLANSAATLTDPACAFDMVRPGLAVYGLSPLPQLGGPAEFGLRPAMTCSADLALVKEIPAGQGAVSYTHLDVYKRQGRRPRARPDRGGAAAPVGLGSARVAGRCP